MIFGTFTKPLSKVNVIIEKVVPFSSMHLGIFAKSAVTFGLSSVWLQINSREELTSFVYN